MGTLSVDGRGRASGCESAAPARYRPLERFYEHSHEIFAHLSTLKPSTTRPPLSYRGVQPSAVPKEVRHILCLDGYCTLALSKLHGEPLGLKVLEMVEVDGVIHRSINLVKESTGLVASLGLISIHLEQMPNDEARRQVRKGVIPFGRILCQHGVSHRSSAITPFVLENNEALAAALALKSSSGHLYGRTNRMVTCDGRTLAEVVEVLPNVYNSAPASPVAVTCLLPRLWSKAVSRPKKSRVAVPPPDEDEECVGVTTEKSSTSSACIVM